MELQGGKEVKGSERVEGRILIVLVVVYVSFGFNETSTGKGENIEKKQNW